MKRRRNFLPLVAVLLLAGCAARAKNVTNLPAGVTEQQAQNWDAAVADLDRIAQSVSAVRLAVLAVRGAGAFPDDKAYGITITALARVDQVELAAANLLKQQPQSFGQPVQQQLAIYMNLITQQLSDLNTAGVTGIKDPQSLQQINGLLSDLANSVKIVIALSQ
jgi:hypothetical protein